MRGLAVWLALTVAALAGETVVKNEGLLIKVDSPKDRMYITDKECEKLQLNWLETKTDEEDVEIDTDPEETETNPEADVEIDTDAETWTDTVETTDGPVRGVVDTSGTQMYFDIPYAAIAKPFQPASNPEKWTDDRYISAHTSKCPQIDKGGAYVGHLDCLTLSIFTPPSPNENSVLFHIHNSKYSMGSGDPSVYGPHYLVSKGIIVVLPNYRIGALGFLCLDNDTAPGNIALEDLTRALRWVSKNIKQFGGDPGKVVVSGDELGGVLAGYLALSSQSNRYFSKAIFESGAVLDNWALDRDPQGTASILKSIIKRLDSTITEDVFETADIPLLLKASKGFEFKPCVQNGTDSFITQSPWEIMNTENISITVMIGASKGRAWLQALKHTPLSLDLINHNNGILLPTDLAFRSEQSKAAEANVIRQQYFGDDKINFDKVDELSTYYMDVSFLSPALRTARCLVSAGATVYFYEFNFESEMHQIEVDNNGIVSQKGHIITYVLRSTDFHPDQGSDEDEMGNITSDLWASFIQSGEPIASGSNFNWKPLTNTKDTDEDWLLIGSQTAEQIGVRLERLRIWTALYDEHFVEINAAAKGPLSLYLTITISLKFIILFGFLRYV